MSAIHHIPLATVEQAVAAIASGSMAVVVDSPDRENEGDLVMAAELTCPSDVNFMATHARGLICVALPGADLDRLEIGPMTRNATDPRGTAFHVSVDLLHGTTTGISAQDRAVTIRALASDASRPRDFTRPGHVFPLRARAGGVLERPGHTEAAVELVTLAGLRPAGVICEIARADGEMARLPELVDFARRHDLPVLAISDLIAHRRGRPLERVASSALPVPQGTFTAIGFRERRDGREHVALVLGDVEDRDGVTVRIHSECFLGDALGSLACDCGARLESSLDLIAGEGRGVLVYVRGREARRLQHGADPRDHAIGAEILSQLGVRPPDNVAYLPSTPEPLLRAG